MEMNSFELKLMQMLYDMRDAGYTEEDISAVMAGFSVGSAIAGGVTYDQYCAMIKDVWDFGKQAIEDRGVPSDDENKPN